MSELALPEPVADRLAPTILEANQPADRPYRGGEGIARFRGIAAIDEWRPEDFIGSTTEVYSGHGVGLSRLPDGRLLRDAIEEDPVGWLGDEHVRRWGSDTRLLVKLLDTRERLFVHYHPNSEFSKRELHRDSGKTEAWIVTAVDGDGEVWLGFTRDISPAQITEWFENQDSTAMLAEMNRFTVLPGDTIFVPASMPHAIGAGITLVELQQPTDLSLILEWRGYNGLDADMALLGLGIESALVGLDTAALSATAIDELRSARVSEGALLPFPPGADEFFRAEIIDVSGPVVLDSSYAVLIVTDGAGILTSRGEILPLEAGNTVLIPYGAGAVTLEGSMRVVRARPALPG